MLILLILALIFFTYLMYIYSITNKGYKKIIGLSLFIILMYLIYEYIIIYKDFGEEMVSIMLSIKRYNKFIPVKENFTGINLLWGNKRDSRCKVCLSKWKYRRD